MFRLILLVNIIGTVLSGESANFKWSISGDDCQDIQVTGYAMRSCPNVQEVRSTGSGKKQVRKFNYKNIEGAF